MCDVRGEVIKHIAASALGSGIAHTGGSQPPCCEDTQATLRIDSCGKKLRLPANSQHQLLSYMRDPR